MKQNEIEKRKSFPIRFLSPIKSFLEGELIKIKRNKKSLKYADPFNDINRTMENSLEEDVDEQIGHFDTEIKVKFLAKRLAQLRKALTRIKLGKYGICEKCGKMIDTDRLAINPEATTCIKCEKDKEV
ncbi:MAG: TraR/DksA C4-type zinc finger protein [Candidatus Shapirobacteria bacterium]|nr:TraR/DksA C4-type zinc finger protein [Candidatus Shapirobacteria bacterium]